MERTKRISSHVSLVDWSDPKELGVQLLNREKMGEGQVLDIEDYHWGELDDDIDREIMFAVDDDDRPKFVALVKSLYERPLPKGEMLEEEESDVTEVKICPESTLRGVLRRKAVDCATALVEGETDTILFINTPLSNGMYPLHVLAECLSYEMIHLFLENGARTNVRTMHPAKGGLLPLNLSLRALSCKDCLSGWTPNQSIFKLIVLLCMPSMKEPLEVNRLLACSTEGVEEILIHYAIKGKLIEMAALLMVAWEKIMPPSLLRSTGGSSLGGSMKIRQFILEEIKVLADKDAKLVSKNNSSDFEDKYTVVRSALVLLEVFESVGELIGTFVQAVQSEIPTERVVGSIKSILGSAGFVLEDEDIDLSDIDCPTFEWGTEMLEKQTSMSQLQDRCMPLHSSFDRPWPEKSVTSSTPAPKSSMSMFSPSVSVPRMQPYHTNCHLEDEFVPTFHGRMQLKEKRTMGVREPFTHVLSSKKFVSFALAIKRGIMRI